MYNLYSLLRIILFSQSDVALIGGYSNILQGPRWFRLLKHLLMTEEGRLAQPLGETVVLLPSHLSMNCCGVSPKLVVLHLECYTYDIAVMNMVAPAAVIKAAIWLG